MLSQSLDFIKPLPPHIPPITHAAPSLSPLNLSAYVPLVTHTVIPLIPRMRGSVLLSHITRIRHITSTRASSTFPLLLSVRPPV